MTLIIPPGQSGSCAMVRRVSRCSTMLMAILIAHLLVQPLSAATFTTSMAAVEWQVSRSDLECKLSQVITGYGSAVFSRSAGERELFYLQQKQMLLPIGEATIGAVRPSWHAENTMRTLGSATVVADAIPLRTEEPLAQQLRSQLLEGMRIIVTRAIEGEHNPVRVILQPLKFRNAHQEYRQCLTQLLPVSFEQVSRTTLYFNDASDDLPAREWRKLEWLVLYAKTDKRVERIYIDGHTDSIGPRSDNLTISKLRAERIAARLVKAGYGADKITIRWHGERYPVASNKDERGRRQNRRVTVRLEPGS